MLTFEKLREAQKVWEEVEEKADLLLPKYITPDMYEDAKYWNEKAGLDQYEGYDERVEVLSSYYFDGYQVSEDDRENVKVKFSNGHIPEACYETDTFTVIIPLCEFNRTIQDLEKSIEDLAKSKELLTD